VIRIERGSDGSNGLEPDTGNNAGRRRRRRAARWAKAASTDSDEYCGPAAHSDPHWRHIFLLVAVGVIPGCANSDFGRVNQTLVTDGIHDWIGRDAFPAKSKPSTFEYVDAYNSMSFTGSNPESPVPRG
jgi:hypothetical protein